jgi:hypothetical protein
MLGDPRSGSEVWEALDREIGKPGENRGQIVPHREFQPAAAFHDRENRRNLGSRGHREEIRYAIRVGLLCKSTCPMSSAFS